MVSPGSRLRDDLYVLYLAALAWFVMPVYGHILARVLPSDVAILAPGLDVAAVVALVAGIGWGARGGPLMVSRAAVIHELGAPASRIAMLLPRLARQGIAAAMFAAVGGAVLLAMAGGASSFSAPALVSAVCASSATLVVFQAVIWNVLLHVPSAPRVRLGLAGALPTLAIVGHLASGGSISSSLGLSVIAGSAALSGIAAVWSLEHVPVEGLWRRAIGLESIRSAAQNFDFQRVLLDLRSAGRPPRPGRWRLAREWMPLPLWRQLAAMQHGAAGHALRLVGSAAALAAVVAFADLREGLVLLLVAGIASFLGFAFAGGLAATADQRTFVVHYPRGSGPLLIGQLVTTGAMALGLGAVAVAAQWSDSPHEATAAWLLCGYGVLGAALQARLGSPNLGAYMDAVELSKVGPLLWARAMLGPAVVFVGTLALFHGLLHVSPQSTPSPPSSSLPWLSWAAGVAAAGAAVVAVWPLETNRP